MAAGGACSAGRDIPRPRPGGRATRTRGGQRARPPTGCRRRGRSPSMLRPLKRHARSVDQRAIVPGLLAELLDDAGEVLDPSPAVVAEELLQRDPAIPV